MLRISALSVLAITMATACTRKEPPASQPASTPASAPASATAPATASQPAAAASTPRTSPVPAMQAIYDFLRDTHGPRCLEQITASWPGGDGSWEIHFREADGRDTHMNFWSYQSDEKSPYKVYHRFPAEIDHPDIHAQLARKFVKRLGYDGNMWGSDWSLGQRFENGASAVTRVYYREKPAESPGDNERGTAIPKPTHVAVCTLRKHEGRWQLFAVELHRYQERRMPAKDSLLRAFRRDEISRMVQDLW